MTVSRQTLAMVGVVVLLVGGAWLWRACTVDDETRITRTLHDGLAAVERKSVRGAMAVLSPAYRDNFGLDIQSVKPMLQRLFFAVEGLRIDVRSQSRPRLSPSGEEQTATVVLAVAVSGSVQGRPVYLMGTPSAPVEVTVTLTRDGRTWLISEVAGLEQAEL